MPFVLFRQVLLAILRHLGVDSLHKVEVQGVDHRDQVHEHIGYFLADRLAERGIVLEAGRCFIRRGPLERFRGVLGLNGNARGEIAGVVVLAPLALGDKVAMIRRRSSMVVAASFMAAPFQKALPG